MKPPSWLLISPGNPHTSPVSVANINSSFPQTNMGEMFAGILPNNKQYTVD